MFIDIELHCSREPASFSTRVNNAGSVPFSVKETDNGLPRKSRRLHVLPRLVPSSIVCRLSHDHRCLPSGGATQMMPPCTFIKNGTDPQNYDAVCSAGVSRDQHVQRAGVPGVLSVPEKRLSAERIRTGQADLAGGLGPSRCQQSPHGRVCHTF